MNNQYSYTELELQKLGLSEKEAKIYLAALELGHSSVQKLAKEVAMSRPTVYRVLDSLQKKELIEKIDRKKGGTVNPKSPDELLGLLRIQKRKVEEQEREFIRIISLLKTVHAATDKNLIEIFSGKEGKKILLEDFSATHAKKIFVLFDPTYGVTQKNLEAAYETIRKRLGKIEIFEFHCDKFKQSALTYVEQKKLDYILPGTLILGEKVLYFSKEQILCIKEEKITELLKFFFQLLLTHRS